MLYVHRYTPLHLDWPFGVSYDLSYLLSTRHSYKNCLRVAVVAVSLGRLRRWNALCAAADSYFSNILVFGEINHFFLSLDCHFIHTFHSTANLNAMFRKGKIKLNKVLCYFLNDSFLHAPKMKVLSGGGHLAQAPGALLLYWVIHSLSLHMSNLQRQKEVRFVKW